MSINNKQWLGLPLNLLWGYIAIAVFYDRRRFLN